MLTSEADLNRLNDKILKLIMYSEEFYKDLKEFYSLEKKQNVINEQLNNIKTEKNKVKLKIINYMVEKDISNKNIKIGNENLKLLQVKQI